MNAILGFKNFNEEELEEAPCGFDLRSKLLDFHGQLMVKAKIPGGKDEDAESGVRRFYFQILVISSTVILI